MVKIALFSGGVFVVAAGIAAVVSLSHFIGFPQVVGDKRYNFTEEVIWVGYDGILATLAGLVIRNWKHSLVYMTMFFVDASDIAHDGVSFDMDLFEKVGIHLNRQGQTI